MLRRLGLALAVLAVAAPSAAAPTQGTWRLLSRAPIRPDAALTSVWTGEEMIVVGRRERRAEDGEVLSRTVVAEAYDAATDMWRRLPSPGATGSFTGYSSARLRWVIPGWGAG